MYINDCTAIQTGRKIWNKLCCPFNRRHYSELSRKIALPKTRKIPQITVNRALERACFQAKSLKTDTNVGHVLCNNHLNRNIQDLNTVTVLFISYKFVKSFLAITFLLLVSSSLNFHDVCQCILYNQKRNFSSIQQKTKIFPIYPHYKNRSLM